MKGSTRQKMQAQVDTPDLLGDCHCYKAGVGVLCKAEDIGLETFLLCLEKDPRFCDFAVHFGDLFFCKCPHHFFIAKELKE